MRSTQERTPLPQEIRARSTANISLLFQEEPLLERPTAARAAGFERIESWWPFADAHPSRADVDAFARAVDDAGVALTGLNLYAGDMPAGERGIACRPDRRAEFDDALEVIVELAERTGCRLFNCLYGQLNDDHSPDVQAEAAVSAIAAASEAVAAFDGVILLEPLARGLNGRYPLVDGDDVIALLEGPLAAAGVQNAGLLFDTFHLGSNGVDIVDAAQRFATHVWHVQIADLPGRHEPGTGTLPIRAALEALLGSGYDGLVAWEYAPTGHTRASLDWLTEWSQDENGWR